MSDLEKAPLWRYKTYTPKRRLARYVLIFFLFALSVYWFGHTVLNFGRFTRIQHKFQAGSPEALPQHDRLKAVKKEFLHAWFGYKDHAWMSDSLMSLSGQGQNQFCGWSATLVDALDTLWIMNLKEEFDEAVEAVTTIDFAASSMTCRVNTFETTIRYLGGLLAAYDLSQDQRLLPKLNELGELLHSAFDTENGMPCSHCDFGARAAYSTVFQPGDFVPLADVGSFYLEFARLSQITGQKKYMDIVAFLTHTFQKAQNQSSIPGLWPEMVDASSISGADATFVTRSAVYSLGALSDSAYEYLVKAHLMLGGLTMQYAKMWTKASAKIRKLLLFRAYIPQADEQDILFSGLGTRFAGDPELTLEPRTQHLACFAGGMFAMASRIFNQPSDLAIGEGLTNGCVWAYDHSPTGIMPETFTLLACPELDAYQCKWNESLWNDQIQLPAVCIPEDNQKQSPCPWVYPPGFFASIDTHYGLRPEAIESVFIMYRITGQSKWRDIGWRMFTSIIKQTRTPYGHASLSSSMQLVNQTVVLGQKMTTKFAAMQRDEMESFWLAETLKYFWLLFSDTDTINLDQWVLNTEAHPLKLNRRSRGFP